MQYPALILVISALVAALPGQQRQALTDGWQIAPEVEPHTQPRDGWIDARVPSTQEDAFGTDFAGTSWYRRKIDRYEGARVRLLFHGAAARAEVFADGRHLFTHLGAWTPFRVDLTEALEDGPIELTVRVDELERYDTQGFLPEIQPHVGGLWRSVELCVDRVPTFDREALFTFGGAEDGVPVLRVDAPVLPGPAPREVSVRVTIGDRQVTIPDGGTALDLELTRDVARWSPDHPALVPVELELLDVTSGEALDRVVRRIGFRELRTDGARILWNGEPLQLRGMLHWGYSAPQLAPPEDAAYWREQLASIKALGCNMVKACLWVPPACFYDLADELGLIVWQEYPTWHPRLTRDRLAALREEFGEFHLHDRSHASVAIRSLTCETGHSADIDVIRALYDQCKAMVPDTLVVDDSAWIEWHRIHDFWDDHPYGNNSWWPGRLAHLREFIAARQPKPLLLGECIAADTWMDLAEWESRGLQDDVWWAPWGIAAQREFAAMIAARFGAATAASLGPWSLDYALRNRKYQIERLRLSIPDAGYTLSVVRDITKTRMGFLDDFGRAKWSPDAWAWHRDTLVAIDVPDDRRAFLPGRAELPLRVSHFGRGHLSGTLRVQAADLDTAGTFPVELDEGELSPSLTLTVQLPAVERPTRFHLQAQLAGTHPAENAWDLWIVPEPSEAKSGEVRVVDALDLATLDFLEQGGRVVLEAGDHPGSISTQGIWFLKGAPWTPPHPLNDALPADFLLELQSFDLERGRVLRGEELLEQCDPLLGFWDTHDVQRVNSWLLAYTTRVGRGRLAVSALAKASPAGRWVREALTRYLATGERPVREWSAATRARARAELGAEGVDLRDWEIALDPQDRGLDEGWVTGGGDADWRPIQAGRHWESQGIDAYDGVAFYRTAFAVPEHWREHAVHAVFDGVDDSYRLYLNGRELGRFGDPETGATVWLERTIVDLGEALDFGATNDLVLRVVDHVGAGGIHRPAYVTTGSVDPTPPLLHPTARALAHPR